MLEFFKFITSSFWVFCGSFLALYIILSTALKLFAILMIAICGIYARAKDTETIKNIAND